MQMTEHGGRRMRCDKCKHWSDKSDEWEAKEVGFRQCMAVRERWVIQDEASPRWSGGDEEWDTLVKARQLALAAARAYVQDGSEYHAELLTAPDFFCALYSAHQ